jgi:hypothetical protein
MYYVAPDVARSSLLLVLQIVLEVIGLVNHTATVLVRVRVLI